MKKWEAWKNKGANSTEKSNSNNNNINNNHIKRQIADSKDKGKGKALETVKTVNIFAKFEEGLSTSNSTRDFAIQLLDIEFFDFGTAHKFTIDVSALIAEANKCINYRYNIALLDLGANIYCTSYYDRL